MIILDPSRRNGDGSSSSSNIGGSSSGNSNDGSSSSKDGTVPATQARDTTCLELLVLFFPFFSFFFL
jgi:hypothetical protein